MQYFVLSQFQKDMLFADTKSVELNPHPSRELKGNAALGLSASHTLSESKISTSAWSQTRHTLKFKLKFRKPPTVVH